MSTSEPPPDSTSPRRRPPLRVAVVGLGWAGQQHLEAYQSIDGVQVIGLAGKEAALLAELGAARGVPHLFDGWEELLELPGLDALSVAVPTFLHAPSPPWIAVCTSCARNRSRAAPEKEFRWWRPPGVPVESWTSPSTIAGAGTSAR